MTSLSSRDLAYTVGSTTMLGRLVAPNAAGIAGRPAVLVVHDAFGRGAPMVQAAERIAGLGLVAFAADLWGNAFVPERDDEIGPLMGSLIRDRAGWEARVDAAVAVLAAQPEVDPTRIGAMGFCLGGSSVLELARRGGRVRGVVSIHGGLDLLQPDWTHASTDVQVLLCTGAKDPLATSVQRDALTGSLDGARVQWEMDLYSGAKHAFTSPWADRAGDPDRFAYDRRASDRAWRATERFFTDLFSHSPAS